MGLLNIQLEGIKFLEGACVVFWGSFRLLWYWSNILIHTYTHARTHTWASRKRGGWPTKILVQLPVILQNAHFLKTDEWFCIEWTQPPTFCTLKCLRDKMLQLLKSSAEAQSDHVLLLSGRKHNSENSRLKLDWHLQTLAPPTRCAQRFPRETTVALLLKCQCCCWMMRQF